MPKKSKPAYYAVRKGRQPGVYETWAECEEQTKGFSGARFRGFPTYKEARAFALGESAQDESSSSRAASPVDYKGKKRSFEELEEDTEWSVVYSDGACKGNGKPGSIAGVGVWWGHNDPRNIAERCPGEQTNNRAELIAILRVLETAPISKKPLKIKTDSKYSIQCFESWIRKWVDNGWISSTGEPIKNVAVIKCVSKLLEFRGACGQKVILEYVKGHSNDIGNDGADYMANLGALEPREPERDWASLIKRVDEELAQITLASEDEIQPIVIQREDETLAHVPLENRAKSRKVEPTGPAVLSPLFRPPSPDQLSTLIKSNEADSTQPSSQNGTLSLISSQKALPRAPQNQSPIKHLPSSSHSMHSPSSTVSQATLPATGFLGNPKSPIKVFCAHPPFVPTSFVPAHDVELNLDDYADCLLDDANLASELSD